MVSVMHKQVHQGASEEQEIWQYAKKMRAMLGEHEKSGYCPEAHERDGATRFPERLSFLRRQVHAGLLGTRTVICRPARF
jgi:hypothetical protein